MVLIKALRPTIAEGGFLMENEEIVESTPTETVESDDDFFSEIDEQIMSENLDDEEEQTLEEDKSDESQKPNETTEDNSNSDEVDLKPLLNALSGKIKYNKEEVNVESIEDLITNVQKGLNYDKKLQELENLQNSRLEKYAKEKADALGISVDEYMDQVEEYEKRQEMQREADELEDLINAGTPESIAKELIASRQQRRQIQQELNDIKAEREEERKEKEKNKEYQDFLNEFPEVTPESIPKEVFEEAEKSSLKESYMKWKLKELEKQLSISKTNEKNKQSSVGSTTDTGKTTEKHERDLFLEGLLDG